MSSLIVEVCKIEEVKPHPNADRLDICRVKGWWCIIQKDSYKVGDLVTFIPPDAVIPDKIIDQYELEYLRNGKRTKSIRLRGELSQGLILPNMTKEREGVDVAQELCITKYEPPEVNWHNKLNCKKRPLRITNPLFQKYTEIENIKNFNTVFQEGDDVVITEKIHGTNFRAAKLPIHTGGTLIRIICNKFRHPITASLWPYLVAKVKKALGAKVEFCYGSHNVQLNIFNSSHTFYGEDVYGKICQKYNLKETLPENTILYAEIYGKGIQDLEYGMEGIDMVVFDVIQNGKYLGWIELFGFCKLHNFPMVPVLVDGKFNNLLLEELTKGNSLIAPNQIREGCVVKPIGEINHPRVGRKILKSINPDYLTRPKGTEGK